MTTSIPTLAEVSQTTRRNRTFAGKPRPIKSGVSLVKVPPVSHRSDVLLDDQIDLVHSIQDDLQRAMGSLAGCKTESEMMFWKNQVDELRARSEEMVLILKVVSKLSRELVYAKMELEHVTKEGGDMMEIRKRVVWLEDRMEALLCRYRQDDRSSATSSRETFDHSDVVLQQVPNSAKLEEHSSAKAIEYNNSAGGLEDYNRSSMSAGGDAGGAGPEVILTSHYDIDDDDDEEEEEEEEGGYSEEYSTTASEDDEDEEEQTDTKGSVFLTEATNSEGGSLHTRKITFSPDVTIGRYDHFEDEDEDDDDDEDGDKDAVTKYWESDHHKFEFSEQREVITRENPLSYHNLGLAVSSSFIERAPTTPSELPWRPVKKPSDLGDAQKIALDKLSERIHDIWGKMEDAAMMSIEFNKAQNQAMNRRPESRLSTSSLAFQMQLESRKSTRSGTRTGKSSSRSRSADNKSVSLPPPHADNLPPVEPPRHTSVVPMLAYHPPVIPKPEVLPIPRTSPEKRYPRISSHWNKTQPEEMSPTMRLVNQMNIAKETKISLYKKKDKKKAKEMAVKPQTSGRRWKIARNPMQTAAQVAAIVSNRRKLSTTHLERESLQWVRIQELLQKLVSKRVEERRDAAMHLGVLDCSDKDILSALINAIKNDKDDKVRYNAAKALISLGHWSELAMTVIVRCIKEGTYDMQLDLVKTLMNARNVHLVNKSSDLGKQLVAKLKALCATKMDKGDLGFESAICLGCMGVRAPVAKLKLMKCLQSKDTNLVMRSLEVLVRQMRATEPSVVRMVLHQFQKSVTWKNRAAAAKLLVLIGAHHLLSLEEPDAVFKVLEQRLFDDPSREVRQEVAVTLTSLGMRDRVVFLVEKRLEDDDDDIRAHAVTATGVLGMKSDRIIRTLLEMLDLDSCEYVRLQVIRTFATLGLTNIKIMRVLRERERAEGPLAREASKALKILSGRRTAMGMRSPAHN